LQCLKRTLAFIWTPECQRAFEALQRALTSPPILAMPNDTGTFYLDTDASNFAIGAVLSQLQDDEERVIAYASKKMSRQQLNYCTTRKELLAVYHFIRYFKHYLLGRAFIVRTDHSALQWLRRTPEPIGQQARWLEVMEEFDFQIVHRAGTKHTNADAMSRRPCRSRNCLCRENMEENDLHVRKVNKLTDPVNEPTFDPTLTWSKEQFAQEQKCDAEIAPILRLMADYATKPPWAEVSGDSDATKALWGQWQNLCIANNVLYRKFENVKNDTIISQIVMPYSYRRDFFRLAHEGCTGGHLGRRRTAEQIQRRGYWPGWSTDVRWFMKACDKCAQYHRGRPVKQTALMPIRVGEPWQLLSIDITGPYPRSRHGNVYILTAVDQFTKWTEALPIPNHTAPTVARALYNHVFCRFGSPLQLLSDQGPEFESLLFQELCKCVEIHKIHTTPYKASTNGMIERFHRTLNSMLAKVVSDDHRDWCEHVPAVIAAYRASVHEVTGYTPNRLFLGRKNRAPLDLIVGTPPDDEAGNENYDEYVENFQEKTRSAYRVVRERLGYAAVKRKSRYDIGLRKHSIAVGDWVWYYYPRRYVGKSSKWQRVYIGPYLVVKLIGSCNAVLQRSRRAKPFVVHMDKLKRYMVDAQTSWLKETPAESVPE